MLTPQDSGVQERLQSMFDEVNKTFPGELFQQWGHEYLVLEVYDREDAEFFREAEAETP
jgi:hypothetical protein